MPMNVTQRRDHWDAVERYERDGWVCERCGEENEEALVLWHTGRTTRAGSRVVCLCNVCEAKTVHGAMVDQ